MKAYEMTKIGTNRGAPRVWIEGVKAKLAGFLPGKRFSARADLNKKTLILSLSDEAGERIVSKRIRGEKEIPIIDINSSELLNMFDGFNNLRVIVQKGRIFLMPAASELAAKERLDRLNAKLKKGETLGVGSISHGGGVLTNAIHHGLNESGLKSKLAFANEIRPELLEQSAEHNDVWNDETIMLSAPMQELAQDQWAMNHLPVVEILEAGLPCSGASTAGRAANKTNMAEAHDSVGHLVVSFLQIVQKVQPAVVVLENVKQYQSTASMYLLRYQLRDMGYDVHEEILQAADWGALEHRERLCMVAVTKGIDFSFANLERSIGQTLKIADILDDIGSEHQSWTEMAGLKAKQERDIAAGKGFKMQIVSPFDTKCPTITKGYAKVRSTDPKLQHPSNPNLLRQFTAAEHARIKGVPESLIEGLSNTVAHELLGQSIIRQPFIAVGALIGRVIKSLSTPSIQCESPVFELRMVG
jgi:DNA (cytosine-5)-methyltransferase 1